MHSTAAGTTWWGSKFFTDAFTISFRFRLEYSSAAVADGMTFSDWSGGRHGLQ